mmetsp:Transcript_9717/g.23947  ORF Transcript_9717/g.23947 Transcript_9717/m.23947 type:complete len:359 (-) Transcript_9717:1070-2146(-)
MLLRPEWHEDAAALRKRTCWTVLPAVKAGHIRPPVVALHVDLATIPRLALAVDNSAVRHLVGQIQRHPLPIHLLLHAIAVAHLVRHETAASASGVDQRSGLVTRELRHGAVVARRVRRSHEERARVKLPQVVTVRRARDPNRDDRNLPVVAVHLKLPLVLARAIRDPLLVVHHRNGHWIVQHVLFVHEVQIVPFQPEWVQHPRPAPRNHDARHRVGRAHRARQQAISGQKRDDRVRALETNQAVVGRHAGDALRRPVRHRGIGQQSAVLHQVPGGAVVSALLICVLVLAVKAPQPQRAAVAGRAGNVLERPVRHRGHDHHVLRYERLDGALGTVAVTLHLLRHARRENNGAQLTEKIH